MLTTDNLLKNKIVVLLTIIISVLFFSALLHKILLVPINQESPDYSSFYKPVAQNLLDGKGLQDARGKPATRYPPGYPVLLALSFKLMNYLPFAEKTVLHFINILYYSLATFFIFLIVQKVTTFWFSLLTVIGFLTYPFGFWFIFQQAAELPFMVFLYAAIWLFVITILRKSNPWILLGAGCLLGFSMLIKPIALGLPVVLSLIYYYARLELAKERLLIHVFIFIVGVVLVVLPWEIWIYIKTRKIILLSSGALPSIVDGLTFGAAPKEYRLGIRVPLDVQDLMAHFQEMRPQLTSLGALWQEILQQLWERPWPFFKFILFKALRVWYGTDSQRHEMVIMLIQLPYLLSFLVSSKQLPGQRKDYQLLALIIWSVVLYFWFMSLLVLPILRYMIPALGLLFILWPLLMLNKLSPSNDKRICQSA